MTYYQKPQYDCICWGVNGTRSLRGFWSFGCNSEFYLELQFYVPLFLGTKKVSKVSEVSKVSNVSKVSKCKNKKEGNKNEKEK